MRPDVRHGWSLKGSRRNRCHPTVGRGRSPSLPPFLHNPRVSGSGSGGNRLPGRSPTSSPTPRRSWAHAQCSPTRAATLLRCPFPAGTHPSPPWARVGSPRGWVGPPPRLSPPCCRPGFPHPISRNNPGLGPGPYLIPCPLSYPRQSLYPTRT